MKHITCTISADEENLGSFTLDPLMQIRIMAEAKLNGQSLPEFIHELLRCIVLADDYQGEIACAEEEDLCAVSNELTAANRLT